MSYGDSIFGDQKATDHKPPDATAQVDIIEQATAAVNEFIEQSRADTVRRIDQAEQEGRELSMRWTKEMADAYRPFLERVPT